MRRKLALSVREVSAEAESALESDFLGRKLIVIGGTSGIGKAVASVALSKRGSVMVVGRRDDKTKAASIELGSRGEDCRGVQETVSAVVVATGVVPRRAAERKDNRHACGERLVCGTQCRKPTSGKHWCGGVKTIVGKFSAEGTGLERRMRRRWSCLSSFNHSRRVPVFGTNFCCV